MTLSFGMLMPIGEVSNDSLTLRKPPPMFYILLASESAARSYNLMLDGVMGGVFVFGLRIINLLRMLTAL